MIISLTIIEAFEGGEGRIILRYEPVGYGIDRTKPHGIIGNRYIAIYVLYRRDHAVLKKINHVGVFFLKTFFRLSYKHNTIK